MSDDEFWSIVLAVLAVVVVLWVCWPHLLLLVGWTTYANGTRGSAKLLDPDDKDEEYQERYFQLVDLGFLPLGMHWSRTGRSLLSSAYVFRLPGTPILASLAMPSYTASLVTGFRDNIILQTVDREVQAYPAEGLLIQSVADQRLRDVLTVHRQRLDALVAAGSQPVPAETLEDFAHLARAVNMHPAHLRWLRGKAGRYLALLLLAFSLCAVVSGALLGFDNPSTWAGVIAVGMWLKWQWTVASWGVGEEGAEPG